MSFSRSKTWRNYKFAWFAWLVDSCQNTTFWLSVNSALTPVWHHWSIISWFVARPQKQKQKILIHSISSCRNYNTSAPLVVKTNQKILLCCNFQQQFLKLYVLWFTAYNTRIFNYRYMPIFRYFAMPLQATETHIAVPLGQTHFSGSVGP